MRVAQPNAPMKYWEVIADKLSAAGWSWGYCSAVTRDRWRWIVEQRMLANGKPIRGSVVPASCMTLKKLKAFVLAITVTSYFWTKPDI
jgi:hypothetical protein